MNREAMKLALKALEWNMCYLPSYGSDTAMAINAMTALREALAEQPAQQEQESWEDLHNALQRIDTAAVGLPTFEVRHEGGLDAVTQNIVDAITALHTQPAQQEPVTDKENEKFRRDVSNFAGADPEATKYALEEFLKNRTAPPAQRTWVGLTDEHVDKAAMKLAECMDYPWAQMPEQGKQSMRSHAKAVIEASGITKGQK